MNNFLTVLLSQRYILSWLILVGWMTQITVMYAVDISSVTTNERVTCEMFLNTTSYNWHCWSRPVSKLGTLSRCIAVCLLLALRLRTLMLLLHVWVGGVAQGCVRHDENGPYRHCGDVRASGRAVHWAGWAIWQTLAAQHQQSYFRTTHFAHNAFWTVLTVYEFDKSKEVFTTRRAGSTRHSTPIAKICQKFNIMDMLHF